jgi:predicted MPP superfamily phosphohydrolase
LPGAKLRSDWVVTGNRKRLTRALTRPPYRDESGRKWLGGYLFRAPVHVVRQLRLRIPGWPQREPALRIAFLSDFHAGSHADDLARLRAIVTQARDHRPDLVLLGGDFVNMMLFGGGRIAPRAIAAALAGLDAPLGRFAVLGNHDLDYGGDEVAAALRQNGIDVLDDERRALSFDGAAIDLIGIPDARSERPAAMAALVALQDRPTIVLAHDPFWFSRLPAGPHLMLSGHTHGGQICLPGIGPLTNKSRAPLRWSSGLIVEGGRHLYVTRGLGTSGLPIRFLAPAEFAVLEVSG